MFELSEQNAPDYLRSRGYASSHARILIKSLSGGIANVVLQCFDPGGGGRAGSDPRTPDERSAGLPDVRPTMGSCLVLKQPLPRFKTEAEWLVDIDRIEVERDCIALLASLLPAGSVPEIRGYDAQNHILAISCAPAGARNWKTALLAGQVHLDAATHAGMLLAMLHSSTAADAAVAARFGDPRLFVQQRIDPYLRTTAQKHPAVASQLETLAGKLLATRLCLIHGDFSPKNILLVPLAESPATPQPSPAKEPVDVSGLFLLDFEVAFFGHPAFDVATLINHFLLKAFFHRANWRAFMILSDNFWQTYRHTADPQLVRALSPIAGHLLGALLLARIDGKSPAEYLIPHPHLQQSVRAAALAILEHPDGALDRAIDTAALHFEHPS
jgi:5-methylthioribose kinase